jgi:hypothetical protein
MTEEERNLRATIVRVRTVITTMLGVGMFSLSASADLATSGSSDAYGLSVNLDLTLLPILGGADVKALIGPEVPVSGTAPNTYNSTLTLASLNASGGTVLTGSLANALTGIITTDATSNVDGTAGSKSASGTAVVNNLSLGVLGGLVGGNSLLGITATTITANSTVTGHFGALGVDPSSGATLTNLAISILGTSVTIPASITPNTTLNVNTILGGVSIILDEQIVSGNGTSGLMLTTNAIDIHFLNVGVSGLGILNGQIVIDHTDAQLSASAVPEPTSLALVFAGAGVLGLARVRKLRRLAKAIPSAA